METDRALAIGRASAAVLPLAEPSLETPPDVAEQQRRRLSFREAIALAGVAFIAGGAPGLKNPSVAEASAATPASAAELPSSVRAVFRTETTMANASVSDFAKGKAKILVNISPKPMPQRWVNRQRSQRNCQWVGKGTAIPWVRTKGYNVRDKSEYGWDNRRSFVCNSIRVLCRNHVLIPRKPPPPKPPKTFFAKTWKAGVSIQAKAKAVATCNVPGSFALAEGRGSAKARVRLKTFAKTRGNVALSAYSKAFAEAKADAKARVICSSQEKIVVVPVAPPEQPTSPPAELIGPDAEIRPIEHTIEGGTNTVCGSATDDKGIKRVDFVKGSPNDPISISSTFQPDAVNTPHKYCATITAAQVEADTPVKMTIIATDTDNLQSNTLDPRASTTFTVKDREF